LPRTGGGDGLQAALGLAAVNEPYPDMGQQKIFSIFDNNFVSLFSFLIGRACFSRSLSHRESL
jgi:hypothetical protein